MMGSNLNPHITQNVNIFSRFHTGHQTNVAGFQEISQQQQQQQQQQKNAFNECSNTASLIYN